MKNYIILISLLFLGIGLNAEQSECKMKAKELFNVEKDKCKDLFGVEKVNCI
jgi:hypothetical protein